MVQIKHLNLILPIIIGENSCCTAACLADILKYVSIAPCMIPESINTTKNVFLFPNF